MGIVNRRVVCCLVWLFSLLFILPCNFAWAQQSTPPAQTAQPRTQDQSSPASQPVQPLPDSPGATASQVNSSGQSTSQAPPPQKTAPVGTAAAEEIGASGVAASRPGGMALAPMKQRRVRVILIRVGLVAAAGAAIGATMALSKASPSSPPGAH